MTAVSVLGDCEVHDLDAEAVGDTFRVFIGYCHPPGAARLPAVYVTDANGAFGMTVDIVRHLQLGGHLPRVLVIGVGYPAAVLRETMAKRCRDLTPTVADEMTGPDDEVLPSGGAASFLSFLADELQPWVAARFPIAPRGTYLGHSLGGLFGAYALLERPGTFERYALVSPSVWWDDREILRRVQHAALHRDGTAAVSIVVGGEETVEGRRRAAAQLGAPRRTPTTAPRDMVRDAEALATALAARSPGIEVRYRAVAGEHHVSVPPIGISYGLRALFGSPGADELVPRHPPGG